MITIDFCYQTITPESAEHGDFDSHGFITRGHWKFPINNDFTPAAYERQQWELGDLRGLISFARSLGIHQYPDADWFYSLDPDINYQTGEETTYSMHIDGTTVATLNRIGKLLEL